MKIPKILLVIGLVILLLATSNMPVLAKTPQVSTTGWFTNAFTTNGGDTLLNSEYVTKVVDKDGRELYRMITPVKPPKIKVPAVEVPQNSVAGALSLGNVPAFDWSYGCSATSAAMMFGYYDRTGYPAIYTGPTNGGVCPLDNSVWGHTHYPGVTCGESPISATHNGVDGRATRGHVDDYWIDYGNAGPDPYIANGWAEHSPFDSAGDFMGTNQSKYSSTDGSTSFYYDGSGAPLSDYTGSEPGDRDGCHGMRLFAESRGYAVLANYTQLIRGVGSNPALGFTFVNYCSQIDAGRPVLIQVNGHTMLGDGYNTTGNIVYLHDTWDYSDHQMTWGGSYSGMAQWGVTVLQLAPAAAAGITVASPNGGESWMLGESRAIQWSSFGVSGNVAIELSRNGGSAWEALFSSLSNDGSESWIVTAPASTTCRMRISSVSNPSIQDTSDGNFAISIPTPDTVQLTNLPQTVGIPAHLPFTLQVQASDSLGHTLTFSLLSGPGSINPSSGFFSWNDPLPGQSDVLIQAACSGGAGDQDTLTLQVTAIPPEASTGSADSLSQSAATLHGEVQPHQLATSAWFQWGLTDQYGQETGHGDAGSGNSWVSVSAPLSGLLSGQLYHCRLVAQNASGLAYGEDCSFTTVSPPPALAIGSISATPQSGVSNWSPVTIQAGANRSGNWSGTIHHPSGA
ncbi:MAG: hypothetical protein NTV33_10510, partial [Coprothermobacterota bacterium]|nr:hypothetical protein [Coprothermobacterota bacterium]